MGKLDGKVALVTGGAMGMGAADAAILASEGATVVVTDVDEKDGNAVAASIGCAAQVSGANHRHGVPREAMAELCEATR